MMREKKVFRNTFCFPIEFLWKYHYRTENKRIVFKCMKKTVWWINKFVSENNRLTYVDLSSFSISISFVPIDYNAQVMKLIVDEFYFQRSFHYAPFWRVDKRCAIVIEDRFGWSRSNPFWTNVSLSSINRTLAFQNNTLVIAKIKTIDN